MDEDINVRYCGPVKGGSFYVVETKRPMDMVDALLGMRPWDLTGYVVGTKGKGWKAYERRDSDFSNPIGEADTVLSAAELLLSGGSRCGVL